MNQQILKLMLCLGFCTSLLACQSTKNTAKAKAPKAPTVTKPDKIETKPQASKNLSFSQQIDAPDTSCKTDDDCALSRMYTNEDGVCCESCTAIGVSKTWRDKYRPLCNARAKDCPMKKCVSFSVSCQNNVCVSKRN